MTEKNMQKMTLNKSKNLRVSVTGLKYFPCTSPQHLKDMSVKQKQETIDLSGEQSHSFKINK